MNYEEYKRDLAVRILRRIFRSEAEQNFLSAQNARTELVMKALDEFLPKDDSAVRGHTTLVDLAPVYEVDECPNCRKQKVQYSDAYEFCNECGYCFN